MNKKFLLIFLLIPLAGKAQKALKLWYGQPAKVWTQALPVGNGRLGAMIFGNPGNELVQLNESSLWSGGPVSDHVNPDAKNYLPKVREAVLAGDYKMAAELSKKMQGVYSEGYLPLADLHIRQQLKTTEATNYYRDLDISRAVATTSFESGGVKYKREIFSSAADQVIVIHITADKPHALSMKIDAVSQLRYKKLVVDKDVLLLKGVAPAHVEPSYLGNIPNAVKYDTSASACKGMRYNLLTKVVQTGGSVRTDTSGIAVKNASEVMIVLSAATSFNGYNRCPVKDGKDEYKLGQAYLRNASKGYKNLLSNHIADYQHYFNRLSLELHSDKKATGAADLPTDKRLKAYSAGGADPGLEALYFQYGRYLLISSSRPGVTPANLQGIWNNLVRPPWSSNFTTNINVQMNYWPAETTNLSEMHEPLLKLIRELAVTGSNTAKEFYGLNGWVVHHNSDIWALSNPVGEGSGDPMWANWSMGGDWLCRHLWEHYQFTRDLNFLKQNAYPLMKGAVEFTKGWLVKDAQGYWVTIPSGSPENSFIDEKGNKGSIALASTMDMSIIRDLFSHYIEASRLLGIDEPLRDSVIEISKKLYPFHIGARGNLNEWYKDWKEEDPHHRHVSHLYGLYPGEQIYPLTTPELAAAAKRTLELRGDEGTGWSKAWKINFWARLLDGNHAYLLLRDLLHLTGEEGTNYGAGGGTYANLFDAHPPFQIDGNFGATAGIAELLLQSHLGEVYLLPALPDAWQSGKVKGLKARGNYEVSMDWSNHTLSACTIKSLSGGICKIRSASPIKVTGQNVAAKKEDNTYLLSLPTQRGQLYTITTDR